MDHVLIVEDREEDRIRLRALLEARGYRVTVAVDGREALAAARRDPPNRSAVATSFTSRLARLLEEKVAQLEAANRKLQLSEARLGSLIAMSSDFLWETDAEHRLTHRNSPKRKPSLIPGFDDNAHLGHRRWELPYLSPDAAGWATHRALLDAHQPFREFEISRLGIDGGERFVLLSGDPVFDASGAFTGYRGIGTDVTERRQSEIALRQSRDLNQLYLDTAQTVIVALDTAGRISMINRAGCALLGYEEFELLGRNWFTTCLPAGADRDNALSAFHLFMAGNAEMAKFIENPVRCRSGAERLMAWHNALLRDAQCRTIGSLSSGEDITERKQTDRALRESSQRLRELSQLLIETEDAVRRRINRELHDRVGASLSAINLNLSILGTGLPPELQQTLGVRLEDTQRLLEETTTHVRDLMAELHPPALDDFGLGAGLRSYVHELSKRATMEFSISGDEAVPRLTQAAEMALFRVAQGALLNAVTHAQASRIEVLFDSSPAELKLSVCDDGSGFEVVRAPMARSSWGFAIMRERAESVGAKLSVDSAPGAGTRIVVAIRHDLR